MKMPKQVEASRSNASPSIQSLRTNSVKSPGQQTGILPQSAEDVNCECRNGILYCEMNKKWYKTNQKC